MPPPTSSLKPNAPANKAANGSSNGAAKDFAGDDKKFVGKPDQAKYNADQDAVNKEIAAIKSKLDAVRSRISLGSSPGSNDRRTVIKAELDALRGEQGKFKADRGRTLDEVKRLQENVQKKIKDAQASRGKLSYKSVGEIDDRIQSLDKQIESGSMKLVDEKKALAEITTLRRARKTLESSGSIDDAIAADRAKIDELKKQLDDPEQRKVSDRFDELKKEMDGLREEGNKAYEERNKLFDERNALSAQLDELYGKKREAAQAHRDANDKYYAKVQADRQARNDRFKAEKAKEEASRREEEIVRLREEAKNPAFAAEIEDCNILLGWFKGKYGAGEVPTTNAGKTSTAGAATAQLQGVKQLEIRQVESDFKGMTLKKKGEDEELGGLFGGGGKKGKKGKKSSNATPSGSATPTTGETGAVNLPMSLLSALLSLGIPPPAGKEDVGRVSSDLETKKAWYEANSAAKTKAEIERVEKLVTKMQKKNALLAEGDDEAEADEETAVTGEDGGAKEPTHTVAVAGGATGPETVEEDVSQLPADASPTEEVKHVDSALSEIKENDPQA